MKEYHKIQSVYKRDPATKHKSFLEGDYSLPEFEYLKNNRWIWTEKVDGTNIRVAFDGEKVVFGGRTDNAQLPAPLVARLTELFSHQYAKYQNLCLYGEGYGGKIQKAGSTYGPNQDFVLFDVWCNGVWLNRIDVEDIAMSLDIDVVPVIGAGTLTQMVDSARDGVKSTWGDFIAEGYVARPETELLTRNGSRVITKVKCRDFI